MGEILFRGKETKSKQWVYGGFFLHKKTTYCFKEDYDANPDNDVPCIIFDQHTDWGLPNTMKIATVVPETVGQFTGLLDRHGKKVFEGDIVKVTDDADELSPYGGDTGIGKVEFFSGLWYVYGGPNNSLYDLNNCGYIEVIGNIHDNPDLLEVSK